MRDAYLICNYIILKITTFLKMQLQHNNLKEFDKRIGVESTKVKNLATSLEKVKKAIE